MGATGKTGGWGGRWVELERPKPSRVADVEGFWSERPEVLSPRCTYWVRQILRGWRPSRRVAGEGYHAAAIWYGVYLWEYLHVVFPLVRALERSHWVAAACGGKPWPAETGLGWTMVEPGHHEDLVCRWTAAGDGEGGNVVNELVFAERRGGPVTWSWPVTPMTLVGGNVLEVTSPLETVLSRADAGWGQRFGVTLAEACGGNGLAAGLAL